jgi:RNA polymerase sigma factor (sigma-70 family)
MQYHEIEQNDTTWQALKDGKPEALSALFHQNYDALFQYGQKLTNYNTELTKEIIQDVFFKIWERRASLGDVRSVKVYLFTAFRRILIDKSRHFKVEEVHIASLNLEDILEDSPEDAFLMEEKRLTDAQKLKNALHKLPNRVQEAITLRYFEEMEYTDIAQVMNLKERTVYNFVHEGLTLLRKALLVLLTTILMGE